MMHNRRKPGGTRLAMPMAIGRASARLTMLRRSLWRKSGHLLVGMKRSSRCVSCNRPKVRRFLILGRTWLAGCRYASVALPAPPSRCVTPKSWTSTFAIALRPRAEGGNAIAPEFTSRLRRVFATSVDRTAAAAALHVARDIPLDEAARTVHDAQRRGAGAELLARWKLAAARLREPSA